MNIQYITIKYYQRLGEDSWFNKGKFAGMLEWILCRHISKKCLLTAHSNVETGPTQFKNEYNFRIPKVQLFDAELFAHKLELLTKKIDEELDSMKPRVAKIDVEIREVDNRSNILFNFVLELFP